MSTKLNMSGKRAKNDEGASEEMRPLCLTQEMLEIYRAEPERFAREVLGSRWWKGQIEIANLLSQHRRVAVKAANGVGKTYLAADIVLWFLYCHRPSVVLTTAPTWRQVESLLWEEIHRRFRRVNALAEREHERFALEGTLLQTRLKVSEGHFAMGLSTDEPVRFQGFHAENLLIVLDEACGVPEEIWDAVEGICVGSNNRVLAISNPLAPTGRFHSLFRQTRWQNYTISAMMHPNVQGITPPIPGAITREAVEDRISAWCAETNAADKQAFEWEGKFYRPESQFLIRVLGEFPTSADNSLVGIDKVEEAMLKGKAGSIVPGTPCLLAVDVARFGSDETVIAMRRGDVVYPLIVRRGQALTETARQVHEIAIRERADAIFIDEIGVGGGVVDPLRETGIAGIVGITVSGKPMGERGETTFLNLRAQIYGALRDRLVNGQIALPYDETLRAQLAAMRYHYAQNGKIQMNSKDDMKSSGIGSPDRADAVALLFCPQAELLSICGAVPMPPSGMRLALVRWQDAEW